MRQPAVPPQPGGEEQPPPRSGLLPPAARWRPAGSWWRILQPRGTPGHGDVGNITWVDTVVLAHRLHVHVDEVPAGVAVSPSVQAGQVRLEAPLVVDGGLVHGTVI